MRDLEEAQELTHDAVDLRYAASVAEDPGRIEAKRAEIESLKASRKQ